MTRNSSSRVCICFSSSLPEAKPISNAEPFRRITGRPPRWVTHDCPSHVLSPCTSGLACMMETSVGNGGGFDLHICRSDLPASQPIRTNAATMNRISLSIVDGSTAHGDVARGSIGTGVGLQGCDDGADLRVSLESKSPEFLRRSRCGAIVVGLG